MSSKTVFLLIAAAAILIVAVQSRFRRIEKATAPQPTESVSTGRMLRPRLPAPRMAARAAPVEAPAEKEQPANAFARLLSNEGNPPELSRAQVEAYLTENRHSAGSLLAASHLARDRGFLQEAAGRYPNEPQVNFAGWVAARRQEDASPEERRQWLEAFKQSAPDNALVDYLAAQDYFRSGQTDRAVAELIAASGKPRFEDYAASSIQNLEEAYLSAGCSEAEARAAAAYAVLDPHLTEMRSLGDSLRELATLYRQAGDEPSAQAALQLGVELGRRLDDSAAGSLLTRNMAGLAIERRMLREMDPNAPYGDTGQTVRSQLDTVTQRFDALRGLWRQTEPVLQTMPERDLISFFDRLSIFGELEALRWAQGRNGGP